MERYKRGKGKRKLLGSHQKCWLWGRHTVLATLQAGTWPILELYLDERLPDDAVEQARNLAEPLSVPMQPVPAAQLARRCHSHEHQGYLAKMTEFPYGTADTVLEHAGDAGLYLVLDRIQDPFNFGSILRSAEIFDIDAVFIGSREQVGVTATVARSSAGAVNFVPVARVNSLTTLATTLTQRGFELVAATEKADTPASDHDFTTPTSLVIGSEARGIAPDLHALCTTSVRIPQHGHTGSLNAAVAASILLYEACRQRAL